MDMFKALRNRTLLAVSLTVFAAYTGSGMVGTVRVLYTESRGASLALISLMGSVYLISTFAFQYPIGWLGDRWERKQILILSLLAQAMLTGLYLYVTDPVMFIVLRFFEGIAAAGMLPCARAMITETVSVEQQGEAFGLFGAFFNIGFLLGPGIGGILAVTGYTSTFVVAIIFRLIAIVLLLTLIHTQRQQKKIVERITTTTSYKMLFTPALIGAYLIAFGNFLYMGFEITLFPLWMHDHLGASVAVIGFAFMAWSVPNALLAPLGGRVADRWPRSWLILIFGLAQIPIYLAYASASIALTVVVLYGVHGAVYAFIQPSLDSHVAASSGSNFRTRVQGMYATSSSIGAFIGAAASAPLYAFNFRLPLFIFGILCVFYVVIGVRLIRTSERKQIILAQPEEQVIQNVVSSELPMYSPVELE
ncbi:MAG TPA: MFS transporter [Ktedonobacteraceae bacterium]|nr:MFS transporter [Ktedonobacteraceae bacterium]